VEHCNNGTDQEETTSSPVTGASPVTKQPETEEKKIDSSLWIAIGGTVIPLFVLAVGLVTKYGKCCNPTEQPNKEKVIQVVQVMNGQARKPSSSSAIVKAVRDVIPES